MKRGSRGPEQVIISSSLLLSRLESSDTQVYEPQTRALLGTDSHLCEVVVLKLRTVPLGTSLRSDVISSIKILSRYSSQLKNYPSDPGCRAGDYGRERQRGHALPFTRPPEQTKSAANPPLLTRWMKPWDLEQVILGVNGNEAMRTRDAYTNVRSHSLCFSTAVHKERCPPRQKSRVERLKAKVEPLST